MLGAVRDRLRAEDLTGRLRPRAAAVKTPPGLPEATLQFEAPPRPAPTEPARAAPSLLQNAGLSTPLVPRSVPDIERRAMSPATPVRAIQMHDLYLLVEVPEGVLVIDQHALHERILFERLKDRLKAGTLERQRLLQPETVALPARQAALVLEHREELAGLGLEVESFGGNTVAVHGYPAVLGNRCSPKKVLQAVADHLAEQGKAPDRDGLFNDLLSLMACHSAVRAGDRLTTEEIAALLAQRHLAQDSHHCPHGRPTSLLFTRQELDRQFRRC